MCNFENLYTKASNSITRSYDLGERGEGEGASIDWA